MSLFSISILLLLIHGYLPMLIYLVNQYLLKKLKLSSLDKNLIFALSIAALFHQLLKSEYGYEVSPLLTVILLSLIFVVAAILQPRNKCLYVYSITLGWINFLINGYVFLTAEDRNLIFLFIPFQLMVCILCLSRLCCTNSQSGKL